MEFPVKMTISFLHRRGIPFFFVKFEGDVLAVVIPLVQFALEFGVDVGSLLALHDVGGELHEGEGGEEPQLAGPEEPEGPEHSKTI